MAYINAKEVKAIRQEIKKTFPDYKFSVRNENHTNVIVTIQKGPEDLIGELLKGVSEYDREYGSINHYHTDMYPKKHIKFIEKIVEIIKTAPAKAGVGDVWFDKSDIMTDYFHTAYYFSVNVGSWDKHYEQKVA